MKLEAGQLLQDIAVAISVAVLMSLVVSVTILPALTNWILSKKKNSHFKLPIIDSFGSSVSKLILKYVNFILKSKKASMLLVSFLIFITASVSYLLLPKLEYLPEGNRNLIFGVMMPPPGYNLDTLTNNFSQVVIE